MILVAIRGQFFFQIPAIWGRGSVELPLLRSKLSGIVREVIREVQITKDAERCAQSVHLITTIINIIHTYCNDV